MIECPNCNRENEDTYRYCLGCGGVLPQKEEPASSIVGCTSCGTDIPPNFKFCGACGTPVTLAEDTAAPVLLTPPATDAPITSPVGGQTVTAGHLIVIKPDGSEGAKIPINGEVTLGRTSNYDVLRNDPFLSPKHASITPSGTGFIVKDLDSLNGVFLRIKGEVELKHNDQIRVGQELLEFHDMVNIKPVVKPAIDDTQSYGSPTQNIWGRLSLICGPNIESRAFLLDSEEVIIGREVGKILFREDGFVSGKHARVSAVEDRYFLKDLGSSNGTYLRMKSETTIARGDLVLMGQQLFRLDA